MTRLVLLVELVEPVGLEDPLPEQDVRQRVEDQPHAHRDRRPPSHLIGEARGRPSGRHPGRYRTRT